MVGHHARSVLLVPLEPTPQGSSPFGNGRFSESIDGVARRLWPALRGMREEGAAPTPTQARAASTMPRHAMWPLTSATRRRCSTLHARQRTRWRWHTAAAVRQELSGAAARRVALKEQFRAA